MSLVKREVIGIDAFKELLKSKGLKATPQRLAVHEAMMYLVHASADMVCQRIEETSQTRITVTSVYNILSSLAELGIYSRRLSSSSKMFFDINGFKHVHLYDRINHEYKDVMDDKLRLSISNLLRGRKFKGYNIEDFDIQIICKPSRANRKKL